MIVGHFFTNHHLSSIYLKKSKIRESNIQNKGFIQYSDKSPVYFNN